MLIECVPNISEGRDEARIYRLGQAFSLHPDVQLVHQDAGHDAHRTVYTLIGPPEAMIQSVFNGIAATVAVLDMHSHQGTHPRIGAVDVVPLVPWQDITLEEVLPYATRLARRVGEELQLPVYLYEASAMLPRRKLLANIRRGEWEGLSAKMTDPDWVPDFGPAQPHPTAGAMVLGGRPILIAFNVNLDTHDVAVAKKIAAAIREKGTSSRPYAQQALRAIGWYQKEFGCAQVSMNLVDPDICPPHQAYEVCREVAEQLGVSVNGSELVGTIPRRYLSAAGYYYAPEAATPAEAIRTAIQVLGLDSVKPFDMADQVL